MGDQIRAVIDADFFIKVTEYEHGTSLFLSIMNDRNMMPIMHRFVADVELKGNPYLSALISNGLLLVMDYKDYLLNDRDRQEYEDYFREAYEKINKLSFSDKEDIFTYAKSHESLGEIRSLYMAVKNKYPYFMSDDNDSKFLAYKFFPRKNKIIVESLYEALIQCRDAGTRLTWKRINPTVTNALRCHPDKINKLKDLYRAHPDVPGKQ